MNERKDPPTYSDVWMLEYPALVGGSFILPTD
ncbi:hypothetical protein JOE23_000232 [Amphibacillus cookii]|nr:hypothetical protein [Amphibacillus cookii]